MAKQFCSSLILGKDCCHEFLSRSEPDSTRPSWAKIFVRPDSSFSFSGFVSVREQHNESSKIKTVQRPQVGGSLHLPIPDWCLFEPNARVQGYMGSTRIRLRQVGRW